MFLAILIDFWFGKRSVTPQPKQLEPASVTPYYRLNELQGAISGMDVPRSQLGRQTVTLAAKAKKRMEAVLGKMAIVGHPLLLAVGLVHGGIQVDDQPLFVLPFQEGIGGSGESAVQGF